MIMIKQQRQEIVEQDLLHRTLQDAGKFAYGTKMVELWVWDATLCKLFRPEGGWWIDPYWHRHEGSDDDPQSQQEGACTFCQLVDKSRQDYVAPPMLSPGVGIPGVLWSDLGHTDRTKIPRHTGRQSAPGSYRGSGTMDANFLLQVFGTRSLYEHRTPHPSSLAANRQQQQQQHIAAPNKERSRIAWRDVKALADDPDQPRNHRLQILAERTDLRWTGGVPFRIKGEEGVVVYYARATVDLKKLQDKTNTEYLIHAADFIGSAWSLRLPRAAVMIRRHDEIARNFRRLRRALVFLVRLGIKFDDLATTPVDMESSAPQTLHVQDVSHSITQSTCGNVLMKTKLAEKAVQLMVKSRGGGTLAPPPASWQQSTLSAIGVLIGLLSLSALNEALSLNLSAAYRFPLAPMAALLALQFGLTSAPAAQPKTIMVGQMVSIVTALIVAEIPSSYFNVWMKQSLACAVAVWIMSKICIVSPPAAANAFVFADGTYQWTSLLTSLIGCVIAILYAVFINNMSDKRQYPSSWGIPLSLQCASSKDLQTTPTEYASGLESIIRAARARRGGKSASRMDSMEPPNSDGINPTPALSANSVVGSKHSMRDVESGHSPPPR